MLTRKLPDPADTIELGQRLARNLRGGDVVFLRGDLGSGKTTLAAAIVRALGHDGLVKSPTYTLIEEYELGALRIVHADLYRLEGGTELEAFGWWDYGDARTLLLIEWPERGDLRHADIDVCLAVTDYGRQAQLRSLSQRGAEVLGALEP